MPFIIVLHTTHLFQQTKLLKYKGRVEIWCEVSDLQSKMKMMVWMFVPFSEMHHRFQIHPNSDPKLLNVSRSTRCNLWAQPPISCTYNIIHLFHSRYFTRHSRKSTGERNSFNESHQASQRAMTMSQHAQCTDPKPSSLKWNWFQCYRPRWLPFLLRSVNQAQLLDVSLSTSHWQLFIFHREIVS